MGKNLVEFFGVKNIIYDNFKSEAEIITEYAYDLPKDTYVDNANCEVYVNWYRTMEEAQNFINTQLTE